MPRSAKRSPSLTSSRHHAAASTVGAATHATFCEEEERDVVESFHDALSDVRSAAYVKGRVWTITKSGQIVVRDPRCKVLAMVDETERCGHPSCIAVVGPTVWVGYAGGIIKVYLSSSVREASGGEFKRHSGAVNAIAHMGHGQHTRVFTGSADFLILMWNREFQVLQKMSGHGGAVRSMCCKGRVLLSASDDGTYRVWDIASGDALQRIHAHSGAVFSVLYHHDMIWTAGEDGLVQVWEGTTYAPLATLEAHDGPVNCLLAIDAEVWSGGVDNTICVWSARDFKMLRRLGNHQGFITSLVKVVAQREHSEVWSAAADKTLHVWGFQQAFDTEECQRLREDLAMAQDSYKQQHTEMLNKYLRMEQKKDERIAGLNAKVEAQAEDLMHIEDMHKDLQRIVVEKEQDIERASGEKFKEERRAVDEELRQLREQEQEARLQAAHQATRAASVPHLESALELEKQRSATLQLKLNEQENEVASANLLLAKKTAELEGHRRVSETENAELKTRLSSRDERVSFLSNEVERAAIGHAEDEEHIRLLESQLSLADAEKERLTDEVARVSQGATEAAEKRHEGHAAFTRQMGDLQDSLDDATEAISRLQHDNDALGSDRDALVAKLSNRDSQLRGLEDQLAQLQQDLDASAGERRRLEAKVADAEEAGAGRQKGLQKLLRDAEAERDEAQSEAASLRKALETNERDFNAHVEAVREATVASCEKPEVAAALREEVAHLNELLRAASAQKEEAEARTDELEELAAEAEGERDAAIAKASRAEASLEAARRSEQQGDDVSPTGSAGGRPPLPPSPAGSHRTAQRLQGLEDRVFDLETERDLLAHQLDQVRTVLPEGRSDIVEAVRHLAEEVADLRAAAVVAPVARPVGLSRGGVVSQRLAEAERALDDARSAQRVSSGYLERIRDMLGAADVSGIVNEIQTLRAAASSMAATSASSQQPEQETTPHAAALESLTDTSSPESSSLSVDVSAEGVGVGVGEGVGAHGHPEPPVLSPPLQPADQRSEHSRHSGASSSGARGDMQLLQDLLDRALGKERCDVVAEVRRLLGDKEALAGFFEVAGAGDWVAGIVDSVTALQKERDEALQHLNSVQELLEQDATEIRQWRDEIESAVLSPETSLKSVLGDYREAVSFISSLYDAARTRKSSNIISLLNDKVEHYNQERVRSISPPGSEASAPTRQPVSSRAADYIEASIGGAVPTRTPSRSPEFRDSAADSATHEGLRDEFARLKEGLVEELQEKERLIESLRVQLSDSAARAAAARASADDGGRLQARLEELTTANTSLRAAVAAEQRLRESLSSRLEDAEAATSDADDRATAAVAEARELRRDLRRDAARVADLQREVDAGQVDAAERAERLADLAEKRVRLERAEQRAREGESRAAKLEAANYELEAQLGTLKASDAGVARDLRRDLRKASGDLTACQERLRDAEDERDALQDAQARHHASLAEARARVHELEAARKAQQGDTDEVHDLRRDLRRTAADAAALKQRATLLEEERDDLKVRAEALEDRINGAKTHDAASLREVRKELRKAAADAAEHKEKYDAAKADLATAVQQEELVRKSKADIIDTLKARLQEAEKAADAADSEKKRISHEADIRARTDTAVISDLRARVGDAEAQADTSRQLESAELRELKAELRKEITQHAESKRRLDAMTARHDEARKQAADKTAQATALTESAARLEAHNATLQAQSARLPSLEDEAARLRARLSEFESAADASRLSEGAELRDLRKDHRKLSVEATGLKQKLEDAEQFIAELEGMLSDSKGRKAEAKDLQRKLDTLTDELCDTRAKAAAAEDLQRSVGMLERQLRQTAEELSDAKVQVLRDAEVGAERDELLAQVAQLQQDRDESREAKRDLRKAKAQLLDMRSTLDDAEADLAELRAASQQSAALKQDLADNKRRVEELQMEKGGSAESLALLQQKLDATEARTQHKAQELAAALEEVESLDSEVQRVTEESEGLRAQLRELTDKARLGQLEAAKWKLEASVHDDTQSNLEATERRLEEKEAELGRLLRQAEEEKRALQVRCDEAEGQLEARQTVSDVQAEVQQKLRSDLSTQRRQAAEAAAAAETLQQDLDDEKDQAERAAAKAAKDLATLQGRLAESEAQYTTKAQEHAETALELQQTEADHRMALTEANELRQLLRAAREKLAELEETEATQALPDEEDLARKLEKQFELTTNELKSQLDRDQRTLEEERTRHEADSSQLLDERETARLEVKQLQEQLRHSSDEVEDLRRLLQETEERSLQSRGSSEPSRGKNGDDGSVAADSGAPSPFATNLDDTARRRASGPDPETVRHLTAELAAAEERVEALQHAVEEWEGGDMQERLRSLEEEKMQLEREVARLHEHLENCNVVCDEKQAEIMQLQEQADTLGIENDQLTKDIVQLKDTIGDTMDPTAQKLADMTEQNTVLVRGLREAEEEASKARDRAGHLEKKLEDLQQEQQQQQQEQQDASTSQLDSSTIGHEAEVKEWQQRCSDLEARVAELRTAASNGERELNQQKQTAEDYREIAKEMTQKSDEAEAAAAALEDTLHAERQKVRDLTRSQAEAESGAASPAKIAELEKQVADLREANQTLRKTIAEFKSKNMFLALDKNQLVDQFTEAESKVAGLLKQATALQEEVAKERDEKEQKDSEISLYKEQIERLSKGYSPAKGESHLNNSSFETPPRPAHVYPDESPVFEDQEMLLETARQELHNMTEEYREQLRINSALRLQIEEMSDRLRQRRIDEAEAEAMESHSQLRPRGAVAPPNGGRWRGAAGVGGNPPANLNIQHSGISPARSGRSRSGGAPHSTHRTGTPPHHHTPRQTPGTPTGGALGSFTASVQDPSFYQSQLDNLDEVAQFLQARTLGVEADAAVVEALNDQTRRVKRDFDKVGALLNTSEGLPGSHDSDRALFESLRDMFNRDTGLLHERNSQLQSSILKLQQAYKHILGILHSNRQGRPGGDTPGRRPGNPPSGTSSASSVFGIPTDAQGMQRAAREAEMENVALRCVVQLVAGQLKLRDDKLRSLKEKHAALVASVGQDDHRPRSTSSAMPPSLSRKTNVSEVVSDLSDLFASVQALSKHLEVELPHMALPELEALEEEASGLVLKYSNLLSEPRSVSGNTSATGRVSPLPPENNRVPAPPSLMGLLPQRAL